MRPTHRASEEEEITERRPEFPERPLKEKIFGSPSEKLAAQGGLKPMRMIYGVLISVVLYGCATDEHGRLINQEEVLWIEKGMTTRTQVVEHFGSPRFEGPLPSRTTSTTTTTATVEGKSHTTITTVHVDEPSTQTKAIYPYTKLQSTTPSM